MLSFTCICLTNLFLKYVCTLFCAVSFISGFYIVFWIVFYLFFVGTLEVLNWVLEDLSGLMEELPQNA